MIDKGQWGNLARTPGLHPEKCHGIFNDHRESGPRFNVSSERRKRLCFLTVQLSAVQLYSCSDGDRHYTGVLGTTQTTG